MKKFLSLALALIMALSLVTVSAGAADFADADKIQYTEAVDLMAALGILEGSNGSFNPQGTLTRGAAAKIVAYIALGAEKAKALSGDDLPFEDVAATSSMRPFIAWCYENGIVNGYSATKFGPKDALSGNAFLKMVLGALKIDGVYTGSNWKYNVQSAAETAKLFTGIDKDMAYFGGAITREEAAQIAFNAMNYVETVNGTQYKVGDMTFATISDAAMYKTALGLSDQIITVTKTAGTLLDNVHKVAIAKGAITTNSANAETKKTTVDGKTFAIDTKLDQLGNYVTIYYKKATTQPTAGYTVYSIVDNCTEVTINTTDKKDDVKAALAAAGITKDEKATVAGTGIFLYTDGNVGTNGSIAITLGTTTGAQICGAYDYMNLIVNDGKVIGFKFPLTKYMTKVADIDTDAGEEAIKLTGFAENAWINNGKIIDTDKGTTQDLVNEYEGIKKNDYVYVTVIGTIYNLEKAETVSGKPTKYNSETGKVTIGGVEYAPIADAVKANPEAGTLSLTAEVVLYVDGQKYFFAAKPAAAKNETDIVYVAGLYTITVAKSEGTADEYGVVSGGNKEYKTYFAQYVTLDGETGVAQITAAEYTELKSTGADDEVDGLFKMVKPLKKTEDKDTAVTDSKNLEAMFTDFTTVLASTDLKLGTVTLSATLKDTAIKMSSDNDYYADGVVFLYITGDKDELEVVVKDGAQKLIVEEGQTLTVKTAYKVDTASGKNTISYVIVDTEVKEETVYTGDVIFVAKDATSKTEAAVYIVPETEDTEAVAYEHEIYVNGVKTKVILKDESITAGFYQMTEYVDGVYELKTGLTNVVSGKTMTLYKGLATIAGVKAEDIDVTGVKVVDLVNTSGDKKVSDATKIEATWTLNVVLEKAADSTSNSVVTIYIITK